MYAIIKDGGRQHKVEVGSTVDMDYRSIGAGETVIFDKVLALSDGEATTLGTPTIEGATVTADVIGTTQGPKLVVQKFRRRKNSRRKTGHRQMYTQVKVSKIEAGS
jgi:large subunit ribosomal protein L21